MGILQYKHPKINRPEPNCDDVAAYSDWLDGAPGHAPARYADEPPTLPDHLWHDPEPCDDDGHPGRSDGPAFEPDADDLAWLESQRADCEGLPETLAELDEQISALRRSLILTEVAAFLAATRFGGHEA